MWHWLKSIGKGFASIGEGMSSIGEGMGSMFSSRPPPRRKPPSVDYLNLKKDGHDTLSDWQRLGNWNEMGSWSDCGDWDDLGNPNREYRRPGKDYKPR